MTAPLDLQSCGKQIKLLTFNILTSNYQDEESIIDLFKIPPMLIMY
jgi:hypothetical protein